MLSSPLHTCVHCILRIVDPSSYLHTCTLWQTRTTDILSPERAAVRRDSPADHHNSTRGLRIAQMSQLSAVCNQTKQTNRTKQPNQTRTVPDESNHKG